MKKLILILALALMVPGLVYADDQWEGADDVANEMKGDIVYARQKCYDAVAAKWDMGRCTAGAGNVYITGPLGSGLAAASVSVVLAFDDPGVALLGTIDADTSGILTSVQIMDDWDESDRAAVNLIVGQAGIAGGTGLMGVTVPRVTLATDDPGVLSLAIIAGWDATHDAAAATEGPQIMGKAHSAQPAAVDNGDATPLALTLYGYSITAGYVWATNSNRVDVINPLSTHHVELPLCDLTNITTNTTDGTCGIWDMDGYRYFSVQIATDDAAPTDILTVTLECSNQDDGTAPASVDFDDLTSALTPDGPALIDSDGYWFVDTVALVKWCKIKYTTSNDAGGDADLTVWLKKAH